MLNIALFGPPGAGKGTQSQFLIKRYNLGYIATGDILREEIRQETELGRRAKEVIQKGGLVSDEIIVQIIEKKIGGNTDYSGFLFDGFPRTFVQAYILEGLLLKLHTSLTALFCLEVPRDESVRRLLKRAESSQRLDDTEDVINVRLQEYEEKTLPVLSYYKQRGTYVPVNGVGHLEEVTSRITSVIDETLRKRWLNVVMLGYPGSGRGTQAKMLAEKFNLTYISTGDVLFEEVKKKTDLGEAAKPYLESGEIVPDEIVIRIVEKHITAHTDSNGFIFKGFPRTIVQAYILDGLLKKQESTVSCIIDLEVSVLQLIRRLAARGNKKNRLTYSTSTEAIVERLEQHERITEPLINYYMGDRREVVRVDGMKNPEAVFDTLSTVVEAAFRKAR
jgi:adenylate kinase